MFQSIRTRALLLLCLMFTALLGMLVYSAYLDRQERLALAMASVHETAERIVADKNHAVQYAQALVDVLAQTHELRDFASTAKCHALLTRILDQEPRLADIALATPNGDVNCVASENSGPINIADRNYFRDALVSHDVVCGNAIFTRSNGKWGLPLARAIRDASGQVIAVTLAVVDLGWINRELSGVKYRQGARLGLVDSSGTVLAKNPDPEHLLGRNISGTSLFKSIVAHRGAGSVTALGTDRVTRVYGFAHFAETAAGPIYLWLGESRAEIVAANDRKFLWTVFATFALLAFTFGAIWFGSDRLLLRPILALADASRRLGQGDYNARSGLRHSRGELGTLARIFDEMGEALMSKSEILRLNRALQVLSRCNKVLIHAECEGQLFKDVCRLIVEVGNYRMAWIGFAESDEHKSVRPAAQFGFEEGYLEAARITWADDERGRGPTGTAIRTGAMQVNQDFAANPLLAPWRADALRRGYLSSAALPLPGETGILGALTIYSAERNAFNEKENILLQELADDLAFGIVTLRSRALHNRDAMRLQSSMEASIEALGTALEMRDPYTAGHQRHVAALSVAIAQELGLPEGEIHGIKFAALIHDIGKIQVSSDILAKPGRLLDIEFQLIQRHSEVGYEILKGIDFPWPIAQFVLQHHERLDGSGYPHRLKGSEILFGARVLAVADTVEAMASHRPYRASLGIDAALAEIQAKSGVLYDAEVVGACCKLFGEGRFAFSD